MKCASVPSEYKNVIFRDSVRTGRNFSPARNVLSITAPSSARFSFVRTNAPPLPGFTCWNSTILKTLPSTSMWVPFLNWLVLIMRHGRLAACRPRQPPSERPHVLGELGRLVQLEVDAEHRNPHGEPAEVVVAGPVLAAVRVDRLDRAPMRGHPPRDLVGGGGDGGAPPSTGRGLGGCACGRGRGRRTGCTRGRGRPRRSGSGRAARPSARARAGRSSPTPAPRRGGEGGRAALARA